jgi:hypothetical protein
MSFITRARKRRGGFGSACARPSRGSGQSSIWKAANLARTAVRNLGPLRRRVGGDGSSTEMLGVSISRPQFPRKADYPAPAGRVALCLGRLNPVSPRVRHVERPCRKMPLGAPEVGASMQPPRSRWSQIAISRLTRWTGPTPTPIAAATLRRPGRLFFASAARMARSVSAGSAVAAPAFYAGERMDRGRAVLGVADVHLRLVEVGVFPLETAKWWLRYCLATNNAYSTAGVVSQTEPTADQSVPKEAQSKPVPKTEEQSCWHPGLARNIGIAELRILRTITANIMAAAGA